MAKFLSFAVAAAVLVASTAAHDDHSTSGSAEAAVTKECAANITATAIATVDNSTWLNSCAPGSTWKLTSLFEAANLSTTDFFTFCNSSTCMKPMHHLLDDVLPADCQSTYHGSEVVLEEKVASVHDACHKLLNAEGATMSGTTSESNSTGASNSTKAGNSSSSVASTPAPAKSVASVSSKSLAALISATAAIVALTL